MCMAAFMFCGSEQTFLWVTCCGLIAGVGDVVA